MVLCQLSYGLESKYFFRKDLTTSTLYTHMKTNCKTCGSETTNPKFCSRSCAATTNNRVPKRIKKKYFCEHCGCETRYRRKTCDDCLVLDMTLAEAKYTKHHKSAAWNLVRGRARSAIPHAPCENCGYEKHTEVCHVKDISSFSEDTLISVVNDPSNLVRLCPNCHWEFDRGWLRVRGVVKE